MTKILNFGLRIKGGGREGGTCEVLRPCHPPPPEKIETRARAIVFNAEPLFVFWSYCFGQRGYCFANENGARDIASDKEPVQSCPALYVCFN